MRLLPLNADADALAKQEWREGPGYPEYPGTWLRPPPPGQLAPEFACDEGHAKYKNEPGPTFILGADIDCHIQIVADRLPDRICRLSKERRSWILEALSPAVALEHCGRSMQVAEQVALRDGDVFSLRWASASCGFRFAAAGSDGFEAVDVPDADQIAAATSFPGRFPARFPRRSSLPESPPAPEELRRLSWQTDRMRRRSEEDLVRVSDWSSFSQYVKGLYFKYGIFCVNWAQEGRKKPVDPPPVPRAPKPLPSWVAELLATEAPVPGVDPDRELPFESCLRSAGQEPATRPPAPASAVNGSAFGHVATAATNGSVANGPVKETGPKLAEWLRMVDPALFLLQYEGQLASRFGSLAVIEERHVHSDGRLDEAFFGEIQVKKLGHRRLFERWFRDVGRRTGR
eukprot:TRINITY_DN21603_c0_g1_i1.p1 TRINITY_DN21603_c0_g1~~TRINITY_DN21603_c0_g1_i1.p1  ORF type:complete len:402 (+),score=74.80 TRINITY_DN21603_c0_g1_i1:166-1371(+)